MRCGDSHAKKRRPASLGQSEPTIPRDHKMFTHFPEGPTCDVCCTAMTTRARCKNGLLGRADEIYVPTVLRNLVTADYKKILNLDDESRHDHQNALVVQDGHSYGVQSYPTKSNDATEPASCLRRFLREFTKVCEDPPWTHHANTLHRGKSCSTSSRRNSDSDGSKWSTRSMEGLFDGVLWLLAQRERQDSR